MREEKGPLQDQTEVLQSQVSPDAIINGRVIPVGFSRVVTNGPRESSRRL